MNQSEFNAPTTGVYVWLLVMYRKNGNEDSFQFKALTTLLLKFRVSRTKFGNLK